LKFSVYFPFSDIHYTKKKTNIPPGIRNYQDGGLRDTEYRAAAVRMRTASRKNVPYGVEYYFCYPVKDVIQKK
jgi:hypothetical protein